VIRGGGEDVEEISSKNREEDSGSHTSGHRFGEFNGKTVIEPITT